MSLPGTNGLEIVHIPHDGGTKVWVYDDLDNVKIGGKETDGALTLVEVDFGPGRDRHRMCTPTSTSRST